MIKHDIMKQIDDEVLSLKKSPLYAFRIKEKNFPVIGEGSLDTHIMFVGEAPGKNEAKKAKPFCGASGKFLTEMLSGIGIDRNDVYITNLVKDRPPENRDPSPKEIALYAPFLDRQIEIIKPKVVVPLGRLSMAYLMKRFGLESELATIGKIHGKIFKVKTEYGKIHIVPLYHPAVALYNGGMRKQLHKDMAILKQFI